MGLQAKLDFHILREFFDLFVKKDFDPINPLIFHPMQILNLIFLYETINFLRPPLLIIYHHKDQLLFLLI